MSKTLFIVRYVGAYRLNWESWRGASDLPRRPEARVLHVFTTYHAAERFQSTVFPPDHINPFRHFYVKFFDPEQNLIRSDSDSGEEITETIDGFCNWLKELGVEPPEPTTISGGAMEAWWNDHAPMMTEIQKRAIWNWSGSEGPYEIVEVKLKGGR